MDKLSAMRAFVEIADRGKGIEDIEQAMQPGFTTSTDEMRALELLEEAVGPVLGPALPAIHVKTSPSHTLLPGCSFLQ